MAVPQPWQHAAVQQSAFAITDQISDAPAPSAPCCSWHACICVQAGGLHADVQRLQAELEAACAEAEQQRLSAQHAAAEAAASRVALQASEAVRDERDALARQVAQLKRQQAAAHDELEGLQAAHAAAMQARQHAEEQLQRQALAGSQGVSELHAQLQAAAAASEAAARREAHAQGLAEARAELSARLRLMDDATEQLTGLQVTTSGVTA